MRPDLPRLQEFQETPSCNLTPAEFEAMLDFDDIEACDPPAFTRLRSKEKEVRFFIHLQLLNGRNFNFNFLLAITSAHY